MQGLRIGSTVTAIAVSTGSNNSPIQVILTGEVTNLTDSYLEVLSSGGTYQVSPWSAIGLVTVTTP